MRKTIIAGNWKCYKTSKEAIELVGQLRFQLESVKTVDIVVCPPYTALSSVAAELRGSTIALGAQNLHWEPQGAFTGEISGPMLVDVGCKFVIVGPSERRRLFGETDEVVHKKLLAALRHGLTPIVCVGETLEEREAGKTLDVVRRQLDGALEGVSGEEFGHIVLAYEPVWAIGTGRTATPAQAQEVHAAIRQHVASRWKAEVAQALRIQYGGSVTAANAAELLSQPDIDGALVGGASLQVDPFSAIVKAGAEQKLAPAK